jgi:hypothetical protein
MSEDAPFHRSIENRPASGWRSVIVDAPTHPQGSNDNTISPSSQGTWDRAELLAAIQAAGRYVRELEFHMRTQTQRLQELVAEVREHLRAAEERAQQAEAREQQTRAWAEATVEAAAERARAAEARAQGAEAWLARVAETIQAEFPNLHEPADRHHDQEAA